MRDPKRIDRMVDVLRRAWKRHPDQRLAQLVVNAARGMHGWPDVFGVEDGPMERRLEALADGEVPPDGELPPDRGGW